MHARRGHGSLPVLIALAIVLPVFPAGCGDSSRTTGTQLQLSEEAKAQIIDMKSIYKENRAAKKTK